MGRVSTVRIVLTSPGEIPGPLCQLARAQLHDARDESLTQASWGPVWSVTGEVDDDVASPTGRVRTRATVRGAATRLGIDAAVVDEPLASTPPRLLVMDVDSTFITGEVLDEVARRAGSGEQVAAITERAMAGELDFADALRARVATVAGLEVSALDEVRRGLELTRGAASLVDAARAAGARVALVSGGFAEVVEPLVDDLGIDDVFANRFEVRDGRLTGLVRGELVDRAAKRRHLVALCERVGCSADEAVAVGDGANDLDMLGAAGLGVAFCAKPVAATQADATISFPRLDAVGAFLRLG